MKTRIILLFTLLLIVNTILIAQTPEWQWAVNAGGSDYDSSYGISIDANGNSYITGYFIDTATFGSITLTSNGGYDIFVAKIDSNGNYQWAENAEGSSNDWGYCISVDANGNSYIIGYFEGTATFGGTTITSSGENDIFVAKMDTNGNWQWAVKAGGSGYDYGWGICLDANGNSYVTGYFRSTATFGGTTLISSGFTDIFVAKIDTNGNWQWAVKAGGSGYDFGLGISIDANCNSYVTGRFESTATFGGTTVSSSGEHDIFVAKINTNGNWQWAKKAGGSDYDYGLGIMSNVNGDSYVTGYFEGTATFGSSELISSGDKDIFVAKIETNGNWQWAKKAGGSDYDIGYGLDIEANGNSYITGYFEGTATFGGTTITSSGDIDIFVAKIDSNGNWQWTINAGGSSADFGFGISIDVNGNSYITGSFGGIATFGGTTITSSGFTDIFVAKLNSTLSAENEISPTEIQLSNYPNPFNPSTKIHYSIKEKSNVRIDVCNIKGQLVKSLINGQQGAGDHSVIWNSKDDNGNKVSSGIYFYKLNVNGEEKAVRKCILLK